MEGPTSGKFERIIGPLPSQREARAFSVIAVTGAVIACGLSLYYGFRGEPFMGRPLGGDFVQFYAAGKVLNQHQPARIYDVSYFSGLQHEILPQMAATQMLPFGYPPVVPQLFRPFALLPYRWAYCAWLVFSVTVYASGLWLLFRDPRCASYRRTAILLSLSAPMYTFETWIGGQLSVIAFLAVVLFIHCFENRWPVLAGLGLGLAAYKPSLIAVPAAVMLLGGCWRMLAGLSASMASMLLASFATAGANGLGLWILRLRVFGLYATSNEAILRRTKYVDLNAFFTILLGENSVAREIATVATATAFLILAWTWLRTRQPPHEVQRYLWAATLTWTLMINIYVPAYDAILLIPIAALLARSVAGSGNRQQTALQIWLIALWLAPWLTQSWADYLHLQILTLALAGLGYWALALARAYSSFPLSVPQENVVLGAPLNLQ
jgi:glycosyl transferase family 87